MLTGQHSEQKAVPMQGQEGQESHRYQDVPDYHEGGNRLAMFTGQHSEQKAVPRDRKVSSLNVTKMYLITMGRQ